MDQEHSRRIGASVALVAWREGWCNGRLVANWRELGVAASVMAPPFAARADLGSGDVCVNRLDVLATLDGIEPGLDAIGQLQRAGVRVVNGAAALVLAHDKLRTFERLSDAGIHQPTSAQLVPGREWMPIPPPVVIKPRHGSWGRDVLLCRTADDFALALSEVHRRPWFQRHGALAQRVLPHTEDLRLVVAAGQVAGAVVRRPARGEWRTNFSLGGSRHRVVPPLEAIQVAQAAALAVGCDLVGVDLIVDGDQFAVLELNGAVDFDRLYSLPGRTVYDDIAELLALPVTSAAPSRVRVHAPSAPRFRSRRMLSQFRSAAPDTVSEDDPADLVDVPLAPFAGCRGTKTPSSTRPKDSSERVSGQCCPGAVPAHTHHLTGRACRAARCRRQAVAICASENWLR